MKEPKIIFIIYLVISWCVFGQKKIKSDSLFSHQFPLEIKLNYSNNFLNRSTNDSTFVKTKIFFYNNLGWKEINVSLRARGNFRRKNCFFTPVKMKIKKSQSTGTIFQGNKSLKLVLPCKNLNDKNDKLIKEFIAYKIYEIVSYHFFKTRRLDVTFGNIKRKKESEYSLKAFFIEDDKRLAERFNGKIVKRYIHPLAMDNLSFVNLSFFNYLIGNTDFSSSNQHNGKLLFTQKKIVPIPYDFDLTGWVNPNYGKGVINRLGYSFEERNFIGFKKHHPLFEIVRKHYLKLKQKVIDRVKSFEQEFDDAVEFNLMVKYLEEFYEILENDRMFTRLIVSQAK